MQSDANFLQTSQKQKHNNKTKSPYTGLSSLLPRATEARKYTNYGCISRNGNFHSTCAYSQKAVDGKSLRNPDRGSTVINTETCYFGITEEKQNSEYYIPNPANMLRKEGSYIRQTADPFRIISSLPLYPKYN